MDIYKLLGQPPSEIQKLLGTDVSPQIKTFKDCAYHNYKEQGVSVCVKNQKIDSIFFYNEGIDGFRRYNGPLPHGINLDMNNVDVVKRLGEPDGKPKPGTPMPIYVDYKHLGLLVDFKHRSYDERNNPIASVCVYPPVQEPEEPLLSIKHLKK